MIYFFSLTIVLLVIAFAIVIAHKNRRKIITYYFYLVSFIMLLILSGFRSEYVGTDTKMFIRIFYEVKSRYSIDLYSDRLEIGYRMFNLLIAKLFSSGIYLLFLSSLIILSVIFWIFIKKSKYPWYSILIFITLMMYYNSMCLMRQYLAVSFACIGIYFLSNKKKYLFLIFTLIGISFHSSTIVVLIMYFIMKIKPSKKIRIKIVLISLISFIAFDKIIILLVELVPKYATYINSQYYLSNKLSVYLDVIILLMIFIFKDYVFFKYQNDDKKLRYNWYCIEYYASMMALIIGVFSIQGSILGRVGIFFEVINCITIANSLSSIKNQKHKYILSICILSFAIIYNFVILIFRPYWSGVIPYSFWS